MPAGRPRISDEQKKARGTAQKCRLNPDKPVGTKIIDAGDPPDHLSDEAKEIFKIVTSELIAAGTLEAVDVNLVLLLCDQYQDYYEASKSRQLYARTQHGEKKIHASVKLKSQALKNIISLSGQLGLSPAARQKIKVVKTPEKKDAASKLLNGSI